MISKHLLNAPQKGLLKRPISTLLIIGVLCGYTQVMAKKIGADPYSANWTVIRDAQRCTLQQDVPQFGKIVFSQALDTTVILELHAATPIYRGKERKLKAQAPSWRSDLDGFLITSDSEIGQDQLRAEFSKINSQVAFKALRDGFRLQLSLIHGTPAEQLHIEIGALGFGAMQSAFNNCKLESEQMLMADKAREVAEKRANEELMITMAKMNANSPKSAALSESDTQDEAKEEKDGEIEDNRNPLRKTLDSLDNYYRIPFDTGDTELSGSSANTLDQLLRRWQLAGMPPEVSLHGHADDADSTASYINSDLRAQSVARYLVSKMPELKMRIIAHGDTLPMEKTSLQRVDVVPSDLPSWE